jgi:hypothetical protein
MSVLTWRNVDAPDFRTSMEGFGQFAQLFGNALSGAQKTVTNIDEGISDRMNNALMAQALQINDPNAFQEAMPDLINSVDPGRLSASTIKSFSERPGALLQNQHAGLVNQDLTADIAHEGKTRERVWGEIEAVDKVSPYLNQAALLRQQGKESEAQAILNSPEAQAALKDPRLTANKVTGLLGDLTSLAQGEANLAGTRMSNEHTGINFQRGTIAYNEARQVESLAETIKARSGAIDGLGTVEWMNSNQDTLIKEMGPIVFGALKRRLMGDPEWNLAPVAGGAGGGASGTPINLTQAHSTVASTLSGGGLSPQVVAGFLGNFEVEAGWNGAQGDGGTAGGIAQWRKERREAFIKRNGMDPTKAPMDVQAKHVLWELSTPEGRKAAGITDAQAQAILNAKTPQEAATLIDAHYERSDGKHRNQRILAAANFMTNLNAGATATTTAIKNNVSGDPNTDLARVFAEKWQDTSPPRAIAQSFVKKGGLYEGSNINAMTKKINGVMQKYGVSAAVAGEILTRADTGPQGKFSDGWGLSRYLTWDGLESRFDNGMIDRLGKLASNRDGLVSATLSAEGSGQAISTVATAQAQLNAATAALQAKQKRAQQLGRQPNLAAETMAVVQAQANYQAAVEAAGGVAVGGERPGRRDPAPAVPIARRPAGPAQPARRNSPSMIIAGATGNPPAWVQQAFKNKFLTK